MLRSLQRSIGLKLAVAVGLPSLGFAVAGVLWLRHEARGRAPGLEAAFDVAVGALAVFAVAMALTHVVAMRVLVGRPLRRLAAGLRRAREGDFLHRVPVDTDDEVGALARDFNSALAAITDLHARRLEDAASLAAMQREVALKRRLEEHVRDLTLLHDLGGRLASTLDPAEVARHLLELVPRALRLDGFAVRPSDPETSAPGVQALTGTVPEPEAAPPGTVRAVPMIGEGGPAGTLAFHRAAEPFTEEEASLLESIASQAALAFTNARLHQEMVRLSLTDALTGVANRRALFARLLLETERCDRFAETLGVALVDVDHFKRLNDRFGHTAGDAILREVARLLSTGLRKVDLVARYGGEEFAILLPGADRGAALAVGEKLRAAIEAACFEHRGEPTGETVTISVGVAVYPLDAPAPSELIDCADAALYAAKLAGRNAVRGHAEGMRDHPGRKRDVRITADVEPPA